MEQSLGSSAEYASAGAGLAAGKSAASWPAIFAGAFVAASVSLVLIALGSGLGFAAVSPWSGRGVSAATFAVTTAIWLIVMQWISAGIGGYIAGRLRTKWVGTHTHEVFFRDTAHGLITWAVATVMVAAVFAASAHSAIGGAAHGMTAMASSTANSYAVDKLFRSAGPGSSGAGASDPKLEADHIIANAAATGRVPDADIRYLAELVAARTGATQADAQRRVDDFIAGAAQLDTRVKAEADAARKAAAQASIYTALAMLIGAFIASVAAALGGRLRDQHI
jgi:hypothetical protein